MRLGCRSLVLLTVFLVFGTGAGPGWAGHGICIRNNSSQSVSYSVKWFGDTLKEPDLAEMEFSIKPGESRNHFQPSDNYSIYLSYYKNRRKRSWFLDTYTDEVKCERKGYIFVDCGRSVCFNKE